MIPADQPIDEFTAMIQKQVRDLGAGFTEQDEDWMPILFLCDPNGQMIVAALDVRFFNSDETKEELEKTIYALILQANAVRVGFVHAGWLAVSTTREEALTVLPSEREDRREVVIVQVIDFDDARFHVAEVARAEDQPPGLLEWKEMPTHLIEGRFVDAIRLALTLKRDLAEDPLGLVERMRDRLDPDDPTHAILDKLIEAAKRDPEILSQMPTREWWNRKKGGPDGP